MWMATGQSVENVKAQISTDNSKALLHVKYLGALRRHSCLALCILHTDIVHTKRPLVCPMGSHGQICTKYVCICTSKAQICLTNLNKLIVQQYLLLLYMYRYLKCSILLDYSFNIYDVASQKAEKRIKLIFYEYLKYQKKRLLNYEINLKHFKSNQFAITPRTNI